MIGSKTVSKRNKQPRPTTVNTKRVLSNNNKSTSVPEHKNAYLDDDDSDDNGDIKILTKEDFEETIKLLSNNKVNNLNIWDVSIIDYFHDLNQLKTPDGKSINFQMASTTLDGCTKVFSKRLDSIVIDADKVLQMVTFHDEKSNKKKKSRGDGDDDDDDDDKHDDDYNPVNKKKASKKNDDEDENLSTMNKLKVSDNQLMFSAIDPVFRKMLSDFDEAGSGSLLLNSLRISPESKVILDDAVGTSKPIYDVDDSLKNVEMSILEQDSEHNEVNPDAITIKKEKHNKIEEEFMDIVADEGKTFRIKDNVKVNDEDSETTNKLLNNFKNIVSEDFENIKLCNELSDIKASILDFEYGKDFLNKMNDKIDNDNDYDDDVLPELNDQFNYDIDDFDLNKDTDNFSGANLTENTNLENFEINPVFNDDIPMNDYGADDEEENEEEMNKREMFLMSKLDERINNSRKNAHWKIRAINSNTNIMKSNIEPIFSTETEQSNGLATKTQISKRIVKPSLKSRNQYMIDFLNDSLDKEIDILFKKEKLTPTSKSRLIDYKLKTAIRPLETTIPDIKIWSSKMLVTAEIKPKRRLRNIFGKRKTTTKADLYADGEFWAAKYNDKNNLTSQYIDDEVADYLYDVMDKKDEKEGGSNELSDELPDFGIDNDPGVYDFDAPREAAGDEKTDKISTQQQDLGLESNRPSWHRDSIKYEKRSKRINVKVLKQNLWDATKEEVHEHKEDLKLSEIVQKTYKKYEGGREKSDLSTSFFFICMLHIANEEGLSIEKTKDLKDLIIHTTSATPIEDLEN